MYIATYRCLQPRVNFKQTRHQNLTNECHHLSNSPKNPPHFVSDQTKLDAKISGEEKGLPANNHRLLTRIVSYLTTS